MKILIANDSDFAHKYIRESWARTLQYSGIETLIWDIRKIPVWEAIPNLKPDILFFQTYNLSDEFVRCIKKHRWIKLCMKASDWGDVSDNIDRQKYPVLIASSKEKRLVQELQEIVNPVLYCHYSEDRMEYETHNHWVQNGFKICPMENAADILEHYPVSPEFRYMCDVGFLGGKWGYKSQTIDRYILPLCLSNLNIKIFGNQHWGIPEYCGFLPADKTNTLFSSAKICPTVSEPHSQVYGYDVIDRPFKLMACGAEIVSDYVEDLVKMIPEDYITYCKSPEEFHHKIINYTPKSTPQDKIKYIVQNHTYFHRLSKLMSKLNCDFLSNQINTAYEQFVNIYHR